MKLEAGMYVRLKGFEADAFGKLHKQVEDSLEWIVACEDGFYNFNPIHDFEKVSNNIIDLIEVGDIIAIKENIDKFKQVFILGIYELELLNQIKSKIEKNELILDRILTKEQYEKMSYKIGE